MIRYTLSVLVLICLAVIAQQFLPVVDFHRARILLLPLIFLCAAVTVPPPSMLLFAFCCGFLWDAQNTLGDHGGDPSVYLHTIGSLRFGTSILLYAAIGYLMQGVQPLFRQGKWWVSAVLAGVALFLYQTAEFLLLNFVRGNFTFPSSVLRQIFVTASATTVLAPFLFGILFLLARLFDHTIRYEGLKRKPKYHFR